MPKRSHPHTLKASAKPPHIDLEKLLGELARYVVDEKTFLALAKKAWRAAHYQHIPKRGKRSVADKCFLAIVDGFDKLGMDSDYCPRFYEMRMGGEEDLSVPSNHQRLPLGRVEKMIHDRVPGIKPSTARKYARLWERETEFDSLTTKARMTLYKQLKKTRPALYKGAKPKPRR